MKNHSLDPIHAADNIVSDMSRYLKSVVPVRSDALFREIERRIDEVSTISQGPLLEATPPFISGATINSLIEEKVLCREFGDIVGPSLPGDRPLYAHQEQSIRKAIDGRNLVIATGTGSGKTESFLVPILDSLAREQEAGSLGPGVRALLLYPMNALANDQLKRLRGVLENYPHITFGRYTGETMQKQDEALEVYMSREHSDPIANEILSRDEMQQNPPHILLTNYAMLEYLLLRPRDLTLFEGPHGGKWKFVVIDEAHAYDGIKGSEITLLLRRLKDRVAPDTDLQYLASSATVGTDMTQVAKFGSSLFGAKVEWDEEDPEHQDIVRPARRQIVPDLAIQPIHPSEVRSALEHPSPQSHLDSIGITDLSVEPRMVQLMLELNSNPKDAKELARVVFPELLQSDAETALLDLVNLGHKTTDSAGSPVLSARYHLFLSSIEGAFVCWARETPHVRITRHNQCPDCDSLMYETAHCKRCGQLHFLGNIRTENGTDFYLPSLGQDYEDTPPRFKQALLVGAVNSVEDEDDSFNYRDQRSHEGTILKLCLICGALNSPDHVTCSSCSSHSLLTVQTSTSDSALSRCDTCGGKGEGQLRRFSTGADATSAVIATSLFAQIPGRQASLHPGQGRQMLMFSDSRQGAAFAAPYLQNTYSAIVHRSLILAALEKHKDSKLSCDEMLMIVLHHAKQAHIIDENTSPLKAHPQMSLWMHRELIEGEERNSLEGLGLLSVRLKRPELPAPSVLTSLGLSDDDAWNLLESLVQPLRYQGAVSPSDEYMDFNDEYLFPRNRPMFVSGRQSQMSQNVLSWAPSGSAYTNKRLSFLERVLTSLRAETDARALLEEIWTALTTHNDRIGWFERINDPIRGIVYRLNANSLTWETRSDTSNLWVCNLCSRVTWINVLGICHTNACIGTLVASRTIGRPEGHYQRLYRSIPKLPLTAQEHTAQLSKSEAYEHQRRFIEGELNVLSCSTTFEMGVDVGELQTVFLRNVPPKTANYIQRAGRAGRRVDSAALVVTLALMRSHDQTTFRDPVSMVSGEIRPPVVVSTNPRVNRRHAHSVVISAFFKNEFLMRSTLYRTAEDFFSAADSTDSGFTRLRVFIRNLPSPVLDSLRAIIPTENHSELDHFGRSFEEELIRLIGVIEAEFHSDSRHFQEEIENAKSRENYALAASLQKNLKTISGRRLIEEFSRKNVLPKYGFPVDTVELHQPLHSNFRMDLSRDLTLAISEFAPGSELVVAGNIVKSAGLRVIPTQNLIIKYYAVCSSCQRLSVSLDPLSDSCDCGEIREGGRGKFVQPEFGFIASTRTRKVLTTRPRNVISVESHLLEVGDFIEASRANTELGIIDSSVYRRSTLCVLNRNVYGVCQSCGYSAPIQTTRNAQTSHENPFTGRPCNTFATALSLGHTFQTDTLQLSFAVGMNLSQRLTILYGLLNGASNALDISRDDINGMAYPGDTRSILLYDAVPAGAGLVRRIHHNIQSVVAEAKRRIETCDCGLDSSCYRCLRVYNNQMHHNDLKRQHFMDMTSG